MKTYSAIFRRALLNLPFLLIDMWDPAINRSSSSKRSCSRISISHLDFHIIYLKSIYNLEFMNHFINLQYSRQFHILFLRNCLSHFMHLSGPRLLLQVHLPYFELVWYNFCIKQNISLLLFLCTPMWLIKKHWGRSVQCWRLIFRKCCSSKRPIWNHKK